MYAIRSYYVYGATSITNFTVCGTIKYGVTILDRGGIVTDIEDARYAFDMQDAVGEIMGYLPSGEYDDAEADSLATTFNRGYFGDTDSYNFV